MIVEDDGALCENPRFFKRDPEVRQAARDLENDNSSSSSSSSSSSFSMQKIRWKLVAEMIEISAKTFAHAAN